MIAYQKIILNQDYQSQDYKFKVLCNLSFYSFELVNAKINDWKNNSALIIIDNSPFPINGSNGETELEIHSSIIIDIKPSNTFYIWTEIRISLIKIIIV